MIEIHLKTNKILIKIFYTVLITVNIFNDHCLKMIFKVDEANIFEQIQDHKPHDSSSCKQEDALSCHAYKYDYMRFLNVLNISVIVQGISGSACTLNIYQFKLHVKHTQYLNASLDFNTVCNCLGLFWLHSKVGCCTFDFTDG